MDIDVEIIDNSEEFLEALPAAIAAGLEAIGLTAEGYAKELCPVDTGRLRNSITHAVDEGEQVVYIGTNVEYAPYVELGTTRMGARPFLGPAASQHSDEYKALMDAAMRSDLNT